MIFTEIGLLSEDRKKHLVWGQPVLSLVEKYGPIVQKEKNIYRAFWGADFFKTGSEINLSTTFSNDTTFYEVEFISKSKNKEDQFALIRDIIISDVCKGEPEWVGLNDEYNIDFIKDEIRFRLTLNFDRFERLSFVIQHERFMKAAKSKVKWY
jgi:hypothetical protein